METEHTSSRIPDKYNDLLREASRKPYMLKTLPYTQEEIDADPRLSHILSETKG